MNSTWLSAAKKHEFCFDLSQNKILRTLETTAESIDNAGDAAPEFLRTVLSSVAFPGLLEVVVIYRDRDLGGWPFCPTCRPDPICSRHSVRPPLEHFPRQREVIREMHGARKFRLVFCAEVYGCMEDIGVRRLGSAVGEAVTDGRFEYLSDKPEIIYDVRSVRTRPGDYHPGTSGQCFLASSL